MFLLYDCGFQVKAAGNQGLYLELTLSWKKKDKSALPRVLGVHVLGRPGHWAVPYLSIPSFH